MLDPELIENVNVNLGTTDVDSPTASATGSTINYRSLTPTEDFHARMVGTVGEHNFQRIFGLIQTGNLTKGGLRGWLSASSATNDLFSGGIGKIDKKQFNFKLYQPLGDNGDFIALAGHWNRNRNNMAPSIYLITQNFGTKPVNSSSSGRYPTNWSEAYFNVGTCSVAPGVSGKADAASTCGTAWEYRYNPSDTGNLRANMRFTLSDKLLLTIDPSVQYTKANGGGTITGLEQTCTGATCLGAPTGYIGGNYYVGRDLNGDGDVLDKVTLLAPSHTQTWRLGVNASLRYKIDANNTLRVAYTYDRGRHHQTGELGYLRQDGFGQTPFPVDTPITDAAGNPIEKRNRMSYAILHQVSGEYSGRFLDNHLDVAIGLRAPFLRRDLTNNCFTTSAGGFVDCLGNASMNAAYAALPTSAAYAAPQQRVIDYNRVLPQAGFTFKFTPAVSMFANYSKGMQVPGTDNLYNAFYFAANSASAHPAPETTDNYDAGLRFNTSKVAIQLSGWYTLFQNRLASAFDQDTQTTIYRNLGKVEKYGFDGSVNYQPTKALSLYAFGSLLKSRIVSNVVAGTCGGAKANSNDIAASLGLASCVGGTAYYLTAGKRESGAPVSTLGVRAEGHISLFDLIVSAKRTGSRYINDQNLPVYSGTTAANAVKIDNAAVGAYTTVDLSLRADLAKIGAPKGTFLQLNVVNMFNKFYVGGFDGSTTAYFTSNPTTTAYLPIPRTITGSISVAL